MEGIHKIMTHLWFDNEAGVAGEFYLKVFKNSKLLTRRTIPGTPSGDVDSLTLEVENINLMLLSAGPYFKINPSISFMISCSTKEEVKYYWNSFIKGGELMMPLEKYDFSELYGWVKDKYGVSWQIMYVGNQEIKSKLRPAIMFVGDNAGKAEEALNFYTNTFKNGKINSISRYGESFPPNKPDMINFAEFLLEGQSFSIMDSAFEHAFQLNEAISFIINCDNQDEIDYYWEKLSADPEAEQCGWIKDKYGLSWQITPTVMNDMMKDADKETIERVTQAFLKMKKFNLAELERAYKGE
jgi:predicted 3-demethylubiquinone-9 3-methyltransferase (glyoxalase superfamily)